MEFAGRRISSWALAVVLTTVPLPALAEQDSSFVPSRGAYLGHSPPGLTPEIFAPGVISTEAVTGPYDVVVLVEAEDIDAVGQLVRTAIQPVEGIVRTLTCPVSTAAWGSWPG